MPTIEEQLRYFAVKVNNGSGCLFQPDSKDYTYVLTVKHNLEIENEAKEKELIALNDIKIYRGNVEEEPISDIIVFQTHETLDLALIVIPYIGDSEMVLTHSYPTKDELLFLYGYPSRLSKIEGEKREDVRCFCNMKREDGLGTEIRTEQGQDTWDINTQKAMLGFSGCGVFVDINGVVVLKGIFPELKDPTGANKKLNSFYISNFNSIAVKLGRKHLLPSGLFSFNPYMEKAFNGLDPYLKQCMDKNMESVVNSPITPIKIAERNKDTLVVPASERYIDNISQSKLWTAWLELLTILKISNPEIEDLDNSCTIVPLFFSANQHLIKGIIKLFLTDQKLKSLIRANGLVVFSSLHQAGGLDYLSKEKVKNLIAVVDRPDPFGGKKMMIDNTSQIPEFSCIHIEHFENKIAQIETYQLSKEEILRLIQQEIINIFNYGS